MMYASAGQTCPRCRHRFRVLEDEAGTHACPKCGFGQEEYKMCDGCSYEHLEHELEAVWNDAKGTELFCPDCWEGE